LNDKNSSEITSIISKLSTAEEYSEIEKYIAEIEKLAETNKTKKGQIIIAT
jgi:hypothetical protein